MNVLEVLKTVQKGHKVMFTDGACHPNPGPGGWAAILIWWENGSLCEKGFTGRECGTTNNRMEIMAAVRPLETMPPCDSLIVVSDSQYVVQSIGAWENGRGSLVNPGWLHSWKARGWMTASNTKVVNVDLWERVIEAMRRHVKVEFRHVRGHEGVGYNERCDVMAVGQKVLAKEECNGEGKNTGNG